MRRLLLAFFERILALFPRGFRQRFGEEMHWDFEDRLEQAARNGSTLRFLFREARDLPVNLLRAHLEQGGMLHFLGAQPVTNSLRGAALFGAAFSVSGLVSTWLLQNWTAPDSLLSRLQVFYYDLFHTEHGLELIAMLPAWAGSLVTGLAVGALLAFLFRGRGKTSRYLLAGMLGWFLHDATHQMFILPANLEFYLGSLHTTWLTYALYILSGAFLGLIFVAAGSGKPYILRWMAVGCVAYPGIAYLYMRLLFQLSIIESPWLFIAMLVLVAVYLLSILLLALKSDLGRKAPGTILGGAAAILLSQILAGKIIRLFFSFLTAQIMEIHEYSIALLFKFAAMDAVYGVVFGLLLGLVLGLQKRNHPSTPA